MVIRFNIFISSTKVYKIRSLMKSLVCGLPYWLGRILRTLPHITSFMIIKNIFYTEDARSINFATMLCQDSMLASL